MNSCVGIVFPGGRDSPYHDKLKGPGNKLIRRFVESGGWYLGLCAGNNDTLLLGVCRLIRNSSREKLRGAMISVDIRSYARKF